MDKLKYIKLENEDGSYSSSIPLSVNAEYVDVNGKSLIEELNEKATKDEIESIVSGNPLVANSISEMIDTTRIYVNLTDGCWYYYNGNNWIIGGTYQSTIINEDDSVIQKIENNTKTGDSLGEVVTENILDGQYHAGYMLNKYGEEVASTYYNTTINFSTIQPNETYYRRKSEGKCYIVFYDKNNNIIPRTSSDVRLTLNSEEKSFVTPLNAVKAKFTILTDDKTDQVIGRQLVTTFVPYQTLNLSFENNKMYQELNESINDDKLNIERIKEYNKTGENLGIIINENILDGQYHSGYTFSATGEEVASTYYGTTGYLKVEPNETYYRKNSSGSFYIIMYDENDNIISGTSSDVRIKLSSGETAFTTLKNTAKVRFSIVSGDRSNQVVGRVETTSFVPYETLEVSFENNKLYKELKDEMEESGMGVIDKTDQLEVIDGYRVISNYIMLDAHEGYSIMNIEAKKGDVITYNQSILTANIIIPIAQKIGTRYDALVDLHKASYSFLVHCDMDITITIKNSDNPEVKWYHVKDWENVLTGIYDTNVKFNYNKVMPLITAVSTPPVHGTTEYARPLTLLHFSDIHYGFGQVFNIKTFMEKYGEYIDDALVTGDLCSSTFHDYSPVYNYEGYNKILLTIGNHDVYDAHGDAQEHGASVDSKDYWATNLEKYNQYFAPNIANWNVTQPDNASTEGLCYYYKDYTVGTNVVVRLIVLDCMAYDNEQHAWLSNVLTDAKTNGYAVLIAEHLPPTSSYNDTDTFDTNFASLMRGMEHPYVTAHLSCDNGNPLELVDTFIDGGGEFVCWLCGHLHYAMVGTLKTHPRQIYIAVEKANPAKTWSDTPRNLKDDTEDLFNLVSIDTHYKLIKVARIGAEYDDHMRHRGTMVINYSTRTLLSSN